MVMVQFSLLLCLFFNLSLYLLFSIILCNHMIHILTMVFQGEFYNYSGCGNTFNCNHPAVRTFIVDCLRYWVTEMHVDGFRFDLASIMTRVCGMQ